MWAKCSLPRRCKKITITLIEDVAVPQCPDRNSPQTNGLADHIDRTLNTISKRMSRVGESFLHPDYIGDMQLLWACKVQGRMTAFGLRPRGGQEPRTAGHAGTFGCLTTPQPVVDRLERLEPVPA